MMDYDSAIAKLRAMLEEDRELVESNGIFRGDDGYSVFGLYDISNQPHSVTVSRNKETVAEFCDMRSALSWCIAKKYQQKELADNIEKLDREHNRLSQHIDFDRQLMSRMRDREQKFIVSTKIDHHRARLALIRDRLSKCISRAKYCQIRGFNDEIARTRRPAPHRTSRPGTRKSSGTKH